MVEPALITPCYGVAMTESTTPPTTADALSTGEDTEDNGARLLLVTFRDGSTLTLESTMGAMAFAENQGLNPVAKPVAYMLAVAHRCIQKQRGASGIEATWQEWGEGPNRPAKIAYVSAGGDVADPTFGPLASE